MHNITTLVPCPYLFLKMPPVDFSQSLIWKSRTKKKVSSFWRKRGSIHSMVPSRRRLGCLLHHHLCNCLQQMVLLLDQWPWDRIFSLSFFDEALFDDSRRGGIRQDGTNNDSLGFLCVLNSDKRGEICEQSSMFRPSFRANNCLNEVLVIVLYSKY